MAKPTFAKVTLDTDKLVEHLARSETGKLVTYKELNDVIGRDVQGSARSNLAAARRRLQREEGIVFGTVVNEGVRRLTDAEKVEAGSAMLPRIRRAAGKASNVLASVERYEDLSPEAQYRHNASMTIFQAARAMTTRSGVKRVTDAVRSASGALPLGRTMALFQK